MKSVKKFTPLIEGLPIYLGSDPILSLSLSIHLSRSLFFVSFVTRTSQSPKHAWRGAAVSLNDQSVVWSANILLSLLLCSDVLRHVTCEALCDSYYIKLTLLKQIIHLIIFFYNSVL